MHDERQSGRYRKQVRHASIAPTVYFSGSGYSKSSRPKSSPSPPRQKQTSTDASP